MRPGPLLIFGSFLIAGCAAPPSPAPETRPLVSREPSRQLLDLSPAGFRLDHGNSVSHAGPATLAFSGRIDPWDWVEFFDDGTYAQTLKSTCGNAEDSVVHGRWTQTGDVLTLVADYGGKVRRVRKIDGGLGSAVFVFSIIEDAQPRNAWEELWERAAASGMLY